jgi:hypothetical protein
MRMKAKIVAKIPFATKAMPVPGPPPTEPIIPLMTEKVQNMT